MASDDGAMLGYRVLNLWAVAAGGESQMEWDWEVPSRCLLQNCLLAG